MSTLPLSLSKKFLLPSVLGVAALAFLAITFVRSRQEAPVTESTSAASAVDSLLSRPSAALLNSITATTVTGSSEPLVPQGGGVIAVVSATCVHCERMLKELAEFSQAPGGRPLNRLTVLTVQGAEAGQEKARSAGLSGVRILGPGQPALKEMVAKLQITGTPTLLHVAPDGAILHRLVGWNPEEAATWHAWMASPKSSSNLPAR